MSPAVVSAFRTSASDLDGTILSRLSAGLRRRIAGQPEEPLRRDIAVALARVHEDGDPGLVIAMNIHLSRSDVPDGADAVETWTVHPPLVEVTAEVADDLALRGPIGPTDLPLAAVPFRELLVNAIVHRSYADAHAARPIVVDVHPDRIAITSPGGLPLGACIVDGRLSGSGVRNADLLGVFQEVGLARNQGLGVGLARQALANRGYHLSFKADAREVRAFITLDVERTLARLTGDTRSTLPRSLVDERILSLVMAATYTASELESALKLPNTTVRSALRRLEFAGFVERTCTAARSSRQAYRFKKPSTASLEEDSEDPDPGR